MKMTEKKLRKMIREELSVIQPDDPRHPYNFPQEDCPCECHEIIRRIDAEFPHADWNLDDACNAWKERSSHLSDNNIKFPEYSDEQYSCTCPTCGHSVCGWCA